MKVPALDAEPELLPHALLYWQAFTFLGERRLQTERPSYIPVSEMWAYAQAHGLADDSEFVADMCHFVSVLDREYVNHANALLEKARRLSKKKGKK